LAMITNYLPPFIQVLLFLLNRRIKTKLYRMDVNSS
jgi:hypothetical protein